jgi:hypothetical protein
VHDAAGPQQSLGIGSIQKGALLHELTIFESASAMDEHVADVDCPVEPSRRTSGSNVRLEPGGELRLRSFPVVRGRGAEMVGRPFSICTASANRELSRSAASRNSSQCKAASVMLPATLAVQQ